MDQVDEGDLEDLLKRLLDVAETGLLNPNSWLMKIMMIITKLLLIPTAANAGGG
jgi:hypothetical protein